MGRHPAGLNYGDCFAYALAKSRACRCCFRAMTSLEPTSGLFRYRGHRSGREPGPADQILRSMRLVDLP